MDALIGLIGTLAGALIGGGIAAYINHKQQQVEPKMLLLVMRTLHARKTCGTQRT
ncbi:MAG: hypothetical protein HY964_10295 [Ignavibacteriales bacterium]|nr:hypothetical protein [Ignavibacteriales bacterium]